VGVVTAIPPVYTFTILYSTYFGVDTGRLRFLFDSADATTWLSIAGGGDGNYEYRMINGAWVAGVAVQAFGGFLLGPLTIQVRWK